MIDPNMISSNPAETCDAFAWLVERASANSTKNFERAVIAFNPLLFIAFQIIF
jgi:hypothetical protein